MLLFLAIPLCSAFLASKTRVEAFEIAVLNVFTRVEITAKPSNAIFVIDERAYFFFSY